MAAAGAIAAALRDSHPELERVAELAADEPVFLVGGAVRDLLGERPRADVDLVVLGDAAALAERLGGSVTRHERFATAKATLDGHEIDIASARSETYASPGALPTVSAADSIEEDLARRDFTINAMAIPLREQTELIDPHGGRADLEAKRLRALHRASFRDDPTRALRAARYASRLGLTLDPETERGLRAADLDSVSADRRRAELERLAREPNAVGGLGLLAEWGLIEPPDGGIELAAAVDELLGADPWRDQVPRATAILTAALGDGARGEDLVAAQPERPSQGHALARGRDPIELILARAAGAQWLDLHMSNWRKTKLAIDGADLLAAGVPEGPAVGRGLEAALRRKLDGEVEGRDEEIRAALAAAEADEVA